MEAVRGMAANPDHVTYILREKAFRRGYVRGVRAMAEAARGKLTEVEREKVLAWAERQLTPWPSEPGAAFTPPPLPDL
ncbi:MAG TPA: hypothetical protein VKS60_03885 [Stellaceae bacterium]|nr:hypothetical protein [Stellaceae bacterium]